jgi:hypothetical protein
LFDGTRKNHRIILKKSQVGEGAAAYLQRKGGEEIIEIF